MLYSGSNRSCATNGSHESYIFSQLDRFIVNSNSFGGATARFVASAIGYMGSCEPGRSRAYSENLRWRIIWQKHALGQNSSDTAKT